MVLLDESCDRDRVIKDIDGCDPRQEMASRVVWIVSLDNIKQRPYMTSADIYTTNGWISTPN